ncbi:MHC class II regulatory factor RFX1 [Microtus ochrogaster]|uniref:MHC class II regulatory factor RFX1 n=1 Tax=Microtus ochrogaster TaxID=79684 RepID=A0A8J6FZC7_MICOH|nr:MHC class II regulatory factor RFX1 [Microtus ochrogaster]
MKSLWETYLHLPRSVQAQVLRNSSAITLDPDEMAPAVPTQHLVVQSTAPGTKGGQVSLTVHSAQQMHSAPERSPVQANNSTSKTAGAPAGTVQQLQVHSVQQNIPVTQEVPGQGE